MPFKSKAQQRYLYAKEPAVAEKFSKETKDFKSLPERKTQAKRKMRSKR